jgi:hypothetical protein
MSIDAMKQALEALEYHQEQTRPIHKTQETIIALRQAIEEAEKQEKLCKYCGGIGRVVCDGRCMPEQEPWDTTDMAHRSGGLAIDDDDIQEYKKPWVGLTDEEIDYIWGISPGDWEDKFAFPRAIEAKLKERNT